MASLAQYEDTYWRNKGYHAENAECSCAMSKKDLFGFVDRVYVGPEGDMVFVQITATGLMQARINKILNGSISKGQWRIRMAEIVRRLLNPTEPHGWIRILVVGWKLNELTWRYERTERELKMEDVAIGTSSGEWVLRHNYCGGSVPLD